MNKKGFTLTELMTVVVIIGILAAVGIGSYKKAVDRAKAQEGLQMGHSVMEGVARYYFDHPELTYDLRSRPDLEKIDVSLSNGDINSSNRKQFVGKNFTVQIESQTAVLVSQKNTNLQFRIYQKNFGANRSSADQCINNIDLCKTIGFTNCDATTCFKP